MNQPASTNAIVQLGNPKAPKMVCAPKLIRLVITKPRKNKNQYLPELILLLQKVSKAPTVRMEL